ncbi:MAG: CRISPR-associated ring nuclease Csm6 [Verrucomicrobiae bacterium]|nr:CRISPR-associated ring nuclease Csm6 [Verrucomicrobiae bacterium]
MATQTPFTSRTALIAVTGMSPAIVTETVWALAQEQPPIIPDEVYVLTTQRGAADLQRELLSPRPDMGNQTVWQALRLAILGPQAVADGRLTLHDPILLAAANTAAGVRRPLEDIRTPEDNAAAAEVILDEIRRLTAQEDLRLIASLAGGRKTMSALLACAMSLLGRREDRLTHVLVNEPFDQPALQPRFYFPTTPPTRHELQTPQGVKNFSSGEAVLQLADVPFVPLRYLLRDQLESFPGRFMDLVRLAAQLVSDAAEPVVLDYDYKSYTAIFDGVAVELSGRDIPFFEFLYERVKRKEPPFAYHEDAEKPFAEFLHHWAPLHLNVNLSHGGGLDWAKNPPDKDDFRKRLNSIRNRLNKAGISYLVQRLFPPHGPLGIPLGAVSIVDEPLFRTKAAEKKTRKPRKKGG